MWLLSPQHNVSVIASYWCDGHIHATRSLWDSTRSLHEFNNNFQELTVGRPLRINSNCPGVYNKPPGMTTV